MTPDLVFVVGEHTLCILSILCLLRYDCSITVISKGRFLMSNLIFLFTCMNFSDQYTVKMDSLSLKRKGDFEGWSGRSEILISSNPRTLILKIDINLVHLQQSEFLACAEALGTSVTGVLRKDTTWRRLVHSSVWSGTKVQWSPYPETGR